MHPSHLELFRLIRQGKTAGLKIFMTQHSHAAWWLNNETLCALNAAIKTDSLETINTILQKLQEDTQATEHPQEAAWIFTYALLKAVDHFCQEMTEWDDFVYFFNHPEIKFTFLQQAQKSWGTWAQDIAIQTGAASAAYQEAAKTKPMILRFIRTQLIATSLKTQLRVQTNINPLDVLPILKSLFSDWSKKTFFSQHSNVGMSFIPSNPTKTYSTLLDLLGAINILQDNDGELPVTLSLNQAQKIILLCAKCFPFSPETFVRGASKHQSLREYWLYLAEKIFKMFEIDPAAIKSLFKKLLDTAWLYTEEYIPLTSTHLLHGLTPETIAQGLYANQQKATADTLLAKTPVKIFPGEGMEIIALYPLPPGKKHITFTGKLDPDSLEYLHCVLMNNPSISFGFATDEIFRNNPLENFPQASCRISVDITNTTQLALLNNHFMSSTSVRQHVGFCLTKKLLLERMSMPELQTLQNMLGPNQTISIQIIESVDNRVVLADMVISKYDLALGPNMMAQTATERMAFYQLYDKFPWTNGFAATTPELQLQTVSLALQQQKPLFFTFSHQHFDPEAFKKIQELLKKQSDKNLCCLIRFDDMQTKRTKDNPMITQCDFVITEANILSGVLFKASLCADASLYASATTKKMVNAAAIKEEDVNGLGAALDALNLSTPPAKVSII